MNIRTVILIGSGNVATHLSRALNAAGIRILQVYGRNIVNARKVSCLCGATATDDPGGIITDADLCISCLTDDATRDVLKKMPLRQQFVVHTSGFMEMNVLADFTDRYGVLYPLQTFKKDVATDFRQVPVFVEANTIDGTSLLMDLASMISDYPQFLTSGPRRYLHLAAVFANNFTNLMYSMAQEIALGSKVDYEYLKPLIMQTARNAADKSPRQVQTGPAMRNDKETIGAHLEMLSPYPAMQEIYRLLSDEIIKRNPSNE